MPNDIQDWTQAVNVTAGTVSISGTPTVLLSGTPAVTISGTPSVSVTGTATVSVANTPAVTISGTPSVTISGTPTVNIAALQSISITGTANVSVTNTPAVTISGTPAVSITGTPTVNISAGQSVQISGTVTTTITGTPTVTVSGTAVVSISGTPTVNLGSGIANVQGTGNLAALNNAVTVAMAGLAGVGFHLAAGTLVGTIVPEISYDGGTTYVGTLFYNANTQATAASVVFASSNTAQNLTVLSAAGATNARVRVSAFTSGTAAATITATSTDTPTIIIGGTPNINIANTPSVTVSGTATVSISGTPAVSISGTPTINIAANQSVTATISGTPTVNISAGQSVSITGTPTVSISGTPAVTVSGTATVSISGTPTVNLGSGIANVQGTGNLGALNNAVTVAMAGLAGVGFHLAAGTLVGTIVPEISYDGGTTYVGTLFYNANTQATAASVVFASSNTAQNLTVLSAAGATNARVRVSAFTSGTAAATITATSTDTPTIIIGGTPNINIANTPAVTVSGTATVTVSNTPAVTISGTATVSVSGTPTVNIAAAQSIAISGTPTVNIATGQSIAITGTPTVQFASGQTVSITGTTNISITGASVNVPVTMASVTIATLTTGTNAWTSASQTIPTGAVAICVQWSAAAGLGTSAGNFKLVGDQTGTNYFDESEGIFNNLNFTGFICYISPEDTTFKVTTNFGIATSVYLSAYLVPVAPTVSNVQGIIGSQPVLVEESASTATTFTVNNAITSSTLNITTNTQQLRETFMSWLASTVGVKAQFKSFGTSPVIFWQAVVTAAQGNWPTAEGHRLTLPSGFQVEPTGSTTTFYGVWNVDTDQ